MSREVFDEFRQPMVRLLEKCAIYVACDVDDESIILGWAAGYCADDGRTVLAYANVRPKMRLYGIGTALVDLVKQEGDERTDFIIYTPPCFTLTKKWNMRYRPWHLDIK